MVRSAALWAVLLLVTPGRGLAQDELPKDVPPPAKGPSQQPLAIEQDPASTALPAGTMIDQPWAVIQALDKITARIRKMPIKVGDKAQFGTLTIEVSACRKAPPEDSPESAAFLKIADGKAMPQQVVFNGWMFSSSPALSAMDHPIYNIWVVDCAADPGAGASVPSAQ